MKIEIYRNKEYKNSYIGICEIPSKKRTIVVDGRPHSLEFPEMKFFIEISHVNDYFFQSLYITNKDAYVLSLPHQTDEGLVCLEDGYSYCASDSEINKLCETVVNYFWRSQFLYHFNDCSFGRSQFMNDMKSGIVTATKYKSWMASSGILQRKYKLVRSH